MSLWQVKRHIVSFSMSQVKNGETIWICTVIGESGGESDITFC